MVKKQEHKHHWAYVIGVFIFLLIISVNWNAYDIAKLKEQNQDLKETKADRICWEEEKSNNFTEEDITAWISNIIVIDGDIFLLDNSTTISDSSYEGVYKIKYFEEVCEIK